MKNMDDFNPNQFIDNTKRTDTFGYWLKSYFHYFSYQFIEFIPRGIRTGFYIVLLLVSFLLGVSWHSHHIMIPNKTPRIHQATLVRTSHSHSQSLEKKQRPALTVVSSEPEEVTNSDIPFENSNNIQILGTNAYGTMVLVEEELCLYSQKEKICSVILPEGEIITPSSKTYDDAFYNSPFICGGNLMCLQTITSPTEGPKMVLHLLATNVEKVFEAKILHYSLFSLWILQYQDGSYGIMQFHCVNNPFHEIVGPEIDLVPYYDYDPQSFAAYYLGDSFITPADNANLSLVEDSIATIIPFYPQKQIEEIYFKPHWDLFGLYGWDMYLSFMVNNTSYQDVCISLSELYFEYGISVDYNLANAIFIPYTSPFTVKEFSEKKAELQVLMNALASDF